LSFGKWKPIESSIEGLAFKENQQVSFKHNKKQVIGTIVTLLNNSAVVTLSMDKVTAFPLFTLIDR